MFWEVLNAFKRLYILKINIEKYLVAGFFLFVQKYLKWRLKNMWRKLEAI